VVPGTLGEETKEKRWKVPVSPNEEKTGGREGWKKFSRPDHQKETRGEEDETGL